MLQDVLPPKPTDLTDELNRDLTELAKNHRRRQLKSVRPVKRPQIILNGKPVIDFSSNNYLGFAQQPALITAAIQATEHYGTGTGGARLIGGTLDLHLELEEKLKAFKDTEAALVFNSGYQANVGLMTALADRHDYILMDRYSHASLVDGAIQSRAKLTRYHHLDLNHLETLLQKAPQSTKKLIVTDTVFSVDGDTAPLQALYAIAEKYNTWLILDEAHATGLFGDQKRSGLWETTGIGAAPRVIQIGTFSKALGSFGAYIAGSQPVIQTLVQKARSFIYSTALPPGVIAANTAAIDLLISDPAHTQKLWQNVEYFKKTCQTQGIKLTLQTPIIPWHTGEDKKALEAAEKLLAEGYYIQPIRPPTVPEGTSRLRITLTAPHTQDQIQNLIKTLS